MAADLPPFHQIVTHTQFFQVATDAVAGQLELSLEWAFINEVQRSERFNPDMNVLIKVDGEPIDIFAIKYDGKWKTHDAIVRELKDKVEQHEALRAREDILISSSGSKFDISALPEGITFDIDDDGYLRVQSKRIAYGDNDNHMILPAHVLRSYTFMQITTDGNILTINDDYVRPKGPKPFCLNLDHTVMVGEETCFHVVRSEEEAQTPKW